MKRTLPIALVVLFSTTAAHAQKITTILGDAWVGIVVTADKTTREIKLRHPDPAKNETFVGFLEEEYKVRLKDGTYRFLQMSEIQPGARIRVFYKSKTRDAGGQKVKVFSIHRLDFLGVDQYTRLREALKLPAAIPLAVNEQTKLPAADPLKVFLAVEQPHLKERFTDWVAEWNKTQGTKHGRIEIVTELSNSDVSLVSFWGRDELVAALPILANDGSGDLRELFPASVYLVTKDGDTLRVLWEKALFMPREKWEGGPTLLEKQIEKMMKARTK